MHYWILNFELLIIQLYINAINALLNSNANIIENNLTYIMKFLTMVLLSSFNE